MENKSLQTTQPNSLISQNELEFANKIGEVLDQTKMIALQTNPIAKALMQANAMKQIDQALTPELMAPVEKLFGNAMGIKTDKAYTPEKMKSIFIEAVLGGWGVIGNQVNVLGGNIYITKNGYLPRLRNFPGLKFNFPFKHQLPEQDPKHLTWSVTSNIEYELDGQKHSVVITNPTKKQDGQSADALWGKADTKCCKWLWNKITGENTMDDSGGDEFVDAIEVKESKVVEVKEVKVDEVVKDEVVKISAEMQEKFNSFISKVPQTTLSGLLTRAKAWLDSPGSKALGVTYNEENLVLTSESLDLGVYNELAAKIVAA